MPLSLTVKLLAASLPALALLSFAGHTTPAVLLVSPLLLFLLFASQKKRREGSVCRDPRKAAACTGYKDPLRWSFLPSTGFLHANLPHVHEVENEHIMCKGLALHQPTHKPELKDTGEYPYAWHLAGRKRLWEIRLQIRFKRIPQSHLYFGLELGGYVPVSGIAKRVQDSLVNAIRLIVGDDFYHSTGDNPSKTAGECEPPTFVMPLWAFDQFVVSEIGEEPDITGDLSTVGMRRTDGVRAYSKAMNEAVSSLSTDKVYTFAFWGVSQFLDCMAWEVNFWGFRLDFNRLCGAAPVYVGMYELMEDQADRRHLKSRKNYLLHVAMWSDKEDKKPSPEALQSILGPKFFDDSSNERLTVQHDKGSRSCGCFPATWGWMGS